MSNATVEVQETGPVYATADIYQAAILLTLGCDFKGAKLMSTVAGKGRMTFFLFADDKKTEESRNRILSRSVNGDIVLFAENFRNLKSVSYDIKGSADMNKKGR